MDRAAIGGLWKVNSSRPRREDNQNLKHPQHGGDSATSPLQDRQPGLNMTRYPETGISRAPEGWSWLGEQGSGCLILRGSEPKPRAFPFFVLLSSWSSHAPVSQQIPSSRGVHRCLKLCGMEASFPSGGDEAGENSTEFFSLA